MKVIDKVLMETLMAEAEKSPRRRAHYNLHASLEEPFHRLLVATMPDTVFPTHRHGGGNGSALQHLHDARQRLRSPAFRVVEQQIAEGDWVATRITARGVHTGAWMDMRPTGLPVEITGVNLDRVVDGRIVEHGGAANMLEALLGIGAVRIVSTDEDDARE